MLRETLREYEVKEQFKYSDMFFSDAVKLWLKECAGRVDEITLQGYYNLSNAHILPYFEELGLKLSEIDRSVFANVHGSKAPEWPQRWEGRAFSTLPAAPQEHPVPNAEHGGEGWADPQ